MPLTGVDERGDQLGARMSFSDMLYKHAVNAAVAYGLVSNKLTYGVGYVNRMFDPVIGIQASDFLLLQSQEMVKVFISKEQVV
jgi:hypothetical protein